MLSHQIVAIDRVLRRENKLPLRVCRINAAMYCSMNRYVWRNEENYSKDRSKKCYNLDGRLDQSNIHQ